MIIAQKDYSPQAQAQAALSQAKGSAFTVADQANNLKKFNLQEKSISNAKTANWVNMGLNLASSVVNFAKDMYQLKNELNTQKANDIAIKASDDISALEADVKVNPDKYITTSIGKDGTVSQVYTDEYNSAVGAIKEKYSDSLSKLPNEIRSKVDGVIASSINTVANNAYLASAEQTRTLAANTFSENLDSAIKTTVSKGVQSFMQTGEIDSSFTDSIINSSTILNDNQKTALKEATNKSLKEGLISNAVSMKAEKDGYTATANYIDNLPDLTPEQRQAHKDTAVSVSAKADKAAITFATELATEAKETGDFATARKSLLDQALKAGWDNSRTSSAVDSFNAIQQSSIVSKYTNQIQEGLNNNYSVEDWKKAEKSVDPKDFEGLDDSAELTVKSAFKSQVETAQADRDKKVQALMDANADMKKETASNAIKTFDSIAESLASSFNLGQIKADNYVNSLYSNYIKIVGTGKIDFITANAIQTTMNGYLLKLYNNKEMPSIALESYKTNLSKIDKSLKEQFTITNKLSPEEATEYNKKYFEYSNNAETQLIDIYKNADYSNPNYREQIAKEVNDVIGTYNSGLLDAGLELKQGFFDDMGVPSDTNVSQIVDYIAEADSTLVLTLGSDGKIHYPSQTVEDTFNNNAKALRAYIMDQTGVTLEPGFSNMLKEDGSISMRPIFKDESGVEWTVGDNKQIVSINRTPNDISIKTKYSKDSIDVASGMLEGFMDRNLNETNVLDSFAKNALSYSAEKPEIAEALTNLGYDANYIQSLKSSYHASENTGKDITRETLEELKTYLSSLNKEITIKGRKED